MKKSILQMIRRIMLALTMLAILGVPLLSAVASEIDAAATAKPKAQGADNTASPNGAQEAAAIFDVSYTGQVAGEETIITLSARTDMRFVYLRQGDALLAAWSDTDEGIQIEEIDGRRVWTLSYTFAETGEFALCYTASADGETMEAPFEATIILSDPIPPAEYIYRSNAAQTGIVIEKYIGAESVVRVPDTLDNYPVVEIAASAFDGNANITTVHLPRTVNKIGKRAFANCPNLILLDNAQ